jgi:hypothetical protein
MWSPSFSRLRSRDLRFLRLRCRIRPYTYQAQPSSRKRTSWSSVPVKNVHAISPGVQRRPGPQRWEAASCIRLKVPSDAVAMVTP